MRHVWHFVAIVAAVACLAMLALGHALATGAVEPSDSNLVSGIEARLNLMVSAVCVAGVGVVAAVLSRR